MSEVDIRPMADADTEAVVAVHLAAFPSFFLTFLGPGFLRELYRGIVADPTGLAYVALVSGRPVGFVAGTTMPARFYSRLARRRAIRFGIAALPAFLRRPSILPRLLRAFGKSGSAAPDESGRAELMSIAVLPGEQTRGGGAQLVARFADEAFERGASAVYLTTDALGNDAVNRFYLRCGFVLARSFTTPEGRTMHEYELRGQRHTPGDVPADC
jgi:ribosomal protein S18 acetylase RimI-like enzyme